MERDHRQVQMMDTIKMDLVEIGWSGVDWIGVAQDWYDWRVLANPITNLLFPLNAGKLSSSCTTVGLSGIVPLHRFSAFDACCVCIYMEFF
jgi:hypothetical protein